MAPVLVSDDGGEFFGIPGHHPPRSLLRVIRSETGMALYEVVDRDLAQWCSQVTVGWWRVQARDDRSTWTDETWKLVSEDWPYDWDALYTPCEETDTGAVPATYWRA